MQELVAGIKTMLEGAGYGPVSLIAAFLLGLFSAIASSCCTLPLIGTLAGYSITRNDDRMTVLYNGLLFMAGVVITLLIIGGAVIFAGQTIQTVSGTYWKIAAGCAAIIFGIGALELFPFSLPKLKLFPTNKRRVGMGAWISGIVFGGAIAVSSLPCNPGVYIILGAAVVERHVIWAFFSLISYAIGFSLPLTLLVSGLSLGKGMMKLQKIEKVIRLIAGIGLIAAGIHFFWTV